MNFLISVRNGITWNLNIVVHFHVKAIALLGKRIGYNSSEIRDKRVSSDFESKHPFQLWIIPWRLLLINQRHLTQLIASKDFSKMQLILRDFHHLSMTVFINDCTSWEIQLIWQFEKWLRQPMGNVRNMKFRIKNTDKLIHSHRTRQRMATKACSRRLVAVTNQYPDLDERHQIPQDPFRASSRQDSNSATVPFRWL